VEYAYDDWCIAQFAKWIGNEDVYKKYIKRSLNYKNLFNPNTKHIHGKDQGLWHQPFNATEVNNFFTEGNAWHYSFSAQQDIKGMIELYGGKQGFLQKLGEMFTTKQSLSGRDQADVTGLIGQYAHGNEPSHHIAYLFNYAGKPWITQELVHKICTEFYPNNPDGLIGNEDCGQMSAWFVLSAIGIYQPTPGSGFFTFGTPLFDETIIRLENGKSFTIKANNRSNNNFYIYAAQLNNKTYTPNFITVEEIENGGELVFEMSNSPNLERGTKEDDLPNSSVSSENFVAVPYFDNPSNRFKTSLSVKLNHIDKKASIYYRIQSIQQNTSNFKLYTKPFSINNTTNITFYAQKKGVKSAVITQSFYKVPSNKTIAVISEVNPLYTGGSKDALIDGILGNINWRRGNWTGYYNKNFEAIIDLKIRKKVSYVGAHLLQDISPWIVYPKQLIVEISDDGKNFTKLITIDNKIGMDEKGPVTQKLGSKVNTRTRFVKFTAINGGNLPEWHESAGKPSHLFIDELFVE
ncbi:MAG: GH92 family glycosyl hydrolase, partial [Chitinophagaceae bacterium]